MLRSGPRVGQSGGLPVREMDAGGLGRQGIGDRLAGWRQLGGATITRRCTNRRAGQRRSSSGRPWGMGSDGDLEDAGKRWLLAPLWGPPSKDAQEFQHTYGDAASGSIMAFEVSLEPAKKAPTLVPIWMSRDMHVPDPPVVANGVVYALQTGENTHQICATPNQEHAGDECGPLCAGRANRPAALFQ